MLNLVLRVVSTSLVIAGAITLAHVATPVVDASMAVPPPAPNNSGSLTQVWQAVGEPRGAQAAMSASLVPSFGNTRAPVVLVSADRVEPVAIPTPLTQAGSRRKTSGAAADVARRDLYAPADRAAGEPWSVPSWFNGSYDITAIASMEGEGHKSGPASLRSRSVFVYDLDRGEVLYTKNADNVRPVASITKLVSALALVSANPDLDREFCIGAEQYPTRSGARSHLSTGDCISGWDAVGAALVASDNRGAYAMAAAADMGVDAFIERMNQVSADLGMDHSSWADPSGLEDENLSTARDIAKATVAVASHPLLSQVASAQMWDVHRSNKSAPRRLFSTDRLGAREDIVVHAAKTGYTDTARYCFTVVVETARGQRLVISLLGADGKLSRWADVDRVMSWANGLDAHSADGLVEN